MKANTRMHVNENGRLLAPTSFRKAIGIKVGDELSSESKTTNCLRYDVLPGPQAGHCNHRLDQRATS
jgi:hypothetical protein